MDVIEIDADSPDDTFQENGTESDVVHKNEPPAKDDAVAVQRHKYARLPLARVKAMMKKDPGCAMIGQDAVFLVTKATEMFIEYLAKETGKQLGQGKRKTILRRDVEHAIENVAHLCFLDGALE